jgi:cell division protein FtsB
MQNAAPRVWQHSSYVPLLIALIAFLGFQAFQTVELLANHRALTQAREAQTGPVAEAEKMRRQLVTLAAKTAELAKNGNQDAKSIVDEYARRGLTFVPPQAASGAKP